MSSRAGLTWDSMMKAGAGMMETASASLQRTLKVQDVTSTKDNDSQPAYALNELVQACNKNTDEARAIASALLRRAASSNPVVKWKALRAIRYICQHSTGTGFKKACGGPNASVIREAISWSGPPHPQLGNALNLRVREAAKETLDEVFRTTPAATGGGLSASNASNGALQGRIQGYGSTTGGKIQGGGGGGGSGGSASGTGLGGVSNGGFTGSWGAAGTGGKKYGGISSDDYFSGALPGRYQTWSNASHSALAASPTAEPISTSAAGAAAGGGLSSPSTVGTSAARAAVGSEESVITELCRGSGGVQPRPTPEALRAFVAKASQLDAEVIALELTHKLFNTPWQERVRALDGMHAVAEAVKIRGGGHPLQGTVDSLRSVTEAFGGVLAHENLAVRTAAGRVMRALGVEAAVATAVAAQALPAEGARGAGAVAPPGDLLGGFEDTGGHGGQGTGVAAAPGAADTTPQVEDLLGGLGDIGGGGQAVPGAATDGLDGFDDLSGLGGLDSPLPAATAAVVRDQGAVNGDAAAAAAAAARARRAGGMTDMFAGLTVASEGSSAAAPGVSGGTGGAAAPLDPDPLDLLMGELSASPAAPAPSGAAAGLNGGVAVLASASAAQLVADGGLLGFDSLVSDWEPQPTAAPAASTGVNEVTPTAAAGGPANSMHGVHALPATTFAGQAVGPSGVPGQFVQPGSPQFSQGGVGYTGMRMQQGMGVPPPQGAWNAAGAQMPGAMGGPIGGAVLQGLAGGVSPSSGAGGLRPQGSIGAPVTQHAFAHAAGSLGGHKDVFDFVNDEIRKR